MPTDTSDMKKRLVSALLIVFSLTGTQADAAAITNLSSVTQVVEVEESGGFKSHEIKAGTTFRMTGKIRVKHNAQITMIDEDEEYAIWKDGVMGPQRSINRSTGSAFR
jgi:hypothetical protein